MKKTLRLAILAAVVSSAFWLPNAYAEQEQKVEIVWQDTGDNSLDALSGYPSCYLAQGKSCTTNNAWKYCSDDGSIGVCICGGSPLTWSCTGA